MKYLYVATSSIYGDGGIFELDLVNRKVERIIPAEKAVYFKQIKDACLYSVIESIDVNNGLLKIKLLDYENSNKVIATESIKMK